MPITRASETMSFSALGLFVENRPNMIPGKSKEINIAQNMVGKDRSEDASKLLDRAAAALSGLPGEGDVVGLRKAIARLRVSLSAAQGEKAAD